MKPRRITASGIVYLFGEEFVPDSTSWGRGTWLAHTGRAVQTRSLAYKLFEAAFVSLVEEGYISLRVEKTKKLWFLPWESVTITREGYGDDLSPSLERAIMDALSGNPKRNRVDAVVKRVIGRRWPQAIPRRVLDIVRWPQDYHRRVLDIVMKRLVETGWLDLPAVPMLDYSAPWAGEAETLKAKLETFATLDPHLHKTLVRDVQGGIRSLETPS